MGYEAVSRRTGPHGATRLLGMASERGQVSLCGIVSSPRQVESSDGAVAPFEKNLEVWRQLWRVIEKSDCLVQIVDSRNPLLFRWVAWFR